MPMMNEDMPMRRGPMGPPAETDTGDNGERPSVFVPKEFFKNENPKIGDHPSIVVKDIDPETGDFELACDYGGSKGGENEGYEAAFDKAMPEEESE